MTTPAGWYPDPTRAQTQRYWDGEAWSDHVAPLTVDASNTGVLTAGWVFAFLMPIVGFVIGVSQINRGSQGIGIVVWSVIMFFVWYTILTS
jgi:hypothetical protein